MNLLLIGNPLIQKSTPYMKMGWYANWFKRIIKILHASNESYDITVVMGDDIKQIYSQEYGEKVVVMEQAELLRDGKYEESKIALGWYSREYDEEIMKYYLDLYGKKIKDAPDIIITMSPVPFLEKLFPKALVLHHEYSIFSRKPFVESWYLDPEDSYIGSYLNKYWKSIKQDMVFGEKEKSLITEFKHALQKLIIEKNPYKEVMEEYRNEFKQIYLLPLQADGFAGVDAQMQYGTQFELLIDVLEKVPSDIGILVTTHPGYKILTEDIKNYLRNKYKNFLYDENTFEIYQSSSQYLIGECDGVITVASSVGVQTLFWDKKLISIGGKFCEFMSDGCGIESIDEVIVAENRNKDDILYWLITRYTFLDKHLDNPEYLSKLLKRLKAKQENNNMQNLYDEIEEPEQLFSYLIDHLDKDIPVSILTEEKLKESILDLSRQLYEKKSIIGSIVKFADAMLDILRKHINVELVDKTNQVDKQNNVYIYGTGTGAKVFKKVVLDNIPNMKLVGFIDRQGREETLFEKPILGINEFKDNYDYICIATQYKEVYYNLLSSGMSQEKIVIVIEQCIDEIRRNEIDKRNGYLNWKTDANSEDRSYVIGKDDNLSKIENLDKNKWIVIEDEQKEMFYRLLKLKIPQEKIVILSEKLIEKIYLEEYIKYYMLICKKWADKG